MPKHNAHLKYILVFCWVILALWGITAQDDDESILDDFAPIAVYTGYMGDDVPDDRYPMQLEVGEALVALAEADNSDLDTYLFLEDTDNNTLAANDDQDSTTFNSRLAYIPAQSGEFTLVMSNYPDTSGDYRLAVYIVPPEIALALQRIELSGPVVYYETDNFRIHYTREGSDAATDTYASKVGETFEVIYEIQITLLGWPIPPPDGGLGGDDRYDVYLADLMSTYDHGGLGYTGPEYNRGDNPHTPAQETAAVGSYIVLDNDYVETGADDPFQMMRATAAHEFHHAIQFGYDSDESHNWLFESTATWMETITFPKDQDATGYVNAVYTYPEVCLGGQGDADPSGGTLVYGTWLFIQSLVDAHGDDFVVELWENVAQYDAFESLEVTLQTYDDTVAEAAARYHLQNLVRDYKFTPGFMEDTVWLEETINTAGEWAVAGEGIQELAANYYALSLPAGIYSVNPSDKQLMLWAIGMRQDEADILPLAADRVLDTSAYPHMYLMVFNPAYDDDVTDCTYTQYSLKIGPGDGLLAEVVTTLDASQYRPLGG